MGANCLTSKLIDERMGQTISCAAYSCDILVGVGEELQEGRGPTA